MDLIAEDDPRLKQTVSAYDFQSETAESRSLLVDAMIDIMLDSNGIGLAAPQIGLNKRLFVIDIDGIRFPCFNPEILNSDTVLDISKEGCLSFPGLFMSVSRPTSITCKFQDIEGKEIVRKFEGIAARCFQHELDHLNGVCFVDMVSPLVLQLAKKRRSKLRKK